jgi:sterol desaturase/sphingolipid hydroxylase (fatty acid hydroxylase superfamily)
MHASACFMAPGANFLSSANLLPAMAKESSMKEKMGAQLMANAAAAKTHARAMRGQVVEKTAALLIAAFGFVAALAWNTAVQQWIESNPVLKSSGPLIYAIAVTVIVVVATIIISWAAEKLK